MFALRPLTTWLCRFASVFRMTIVMFTTPHSACEELALGTSRDPTATTRVWILNGRALPWLHLRYKIVVLINTCLEEKRNVHSGYHVEFVILGIHQNRRIA